MNLYIETENGQPKNHPAFEDNLIEAFGAIPDHWETFVRIEQPIPSTYQILESAESTYQKINSVWTDVWALRDMTAEEKNAKQQAVKDEWAARPNRENFSTWSFNELTCEYQPPVPRPAADYFWQYTTLTWVKLPTMPNDEKKYKLDVPSATWVEVTE